MYLQIIIVDTVYTDMKLADIFKFIEGISYNDDGELVMDEAHKRLYLKLKSVIDDFEDTPIHKKNWGEFVKAQGKPIIVVTKMRQIPFRRVIASIMGSFGAVIVGEM